MGRYEIRMVFPAVASSDDREEADALATELSLSEKQPYIVRDTFSGRVWPSAGFPFSPPQKRRP